MAVTLQHTNTKTPSQVQGRSVHPTKGAKAKLCAREQATTRQPTLSCVIVSVRPRAFILIFIISPLRHSTFSLRSIDQISTVPSGDNEIITNVAVAALCYIHPASGHRQTCSSLLFTPRYHPLRGHRPSPPQPRLAHFFSSQSSKWRLSS